MAYATLAQLQGEYGDRAILDAVPQSAANTPEEVWGRRLDGASGFIDAKLKKQGYRLPIDFDSLDAEVARRLSAQLSSWCMALALEYGGAALIAAPEGQKTIARLAREELNQVASGEIVLPLPMASETIVAVPGFNNRGASDPLVDFDSRIFDRAVEPWLTT